MNAGSVNQLHWLGPFYVEIKCHAIQAMFEGILSLKRDSRTDINVEKE